MQRSNPPLVETLRASRARARPAGRHGCFNPATRQKLLAFASLLALMLFFTLASPNFMQAATWFAILQATAVNGVLAIACTFVIITGGIDLSVGTLMTFLPVMAARRSHLLGHALRVGVLAAVVFGALCGFVSGCLIAKLRAALHRDPGHDDAAKGLVAGDLGHQAASTSATRRSSRRSRRNRSSAGSSRVADPERGADPVLVAVAASLILNKTVLGRYTFALGSNEEAVRLSGVNVDFWKIAVYSLNGAICGVAGC